MQEMVFNALRNYKQSGFKIRINVHCQAVNQIERPKSTPLQTIITKSSAGEIATEVINDQTEVPNEFFLRPMVRFTALIDVILFAINVFNLYCELVYIHSSEHL